MKFEFWRRTRAAVCGVVCLGAAGLAWPQPMVAVVTGDAGVVARWVMHHADHQGRPFAVVSKRDARMHVFDASGSLVGTTSVLLGLAPGDRDAGAHIGMRSVASLAPIERTTPAGRFDTEPGRNDKGEAIVWFDYDAALAIHRLRPAAVEDRRPQRMASAEPQERRITFGCIVVPVSFYEQVISPTLGTRRGVVYVLPEEGPVGTMLRDIDQSLRAP